MSILKGDTVVQIMPDAIKGTVERFAVDQETGELQIFVSYTGADGVEEHGRHFKVSELAVVETPAVEPTVTE